MTTDETAKQLIEMSEPVAVAFYQPVMMDGKPLNMVTSLTPLSTADLQAMARLWNLRKEMPYCGIEPGCECNFCDYIHGRTETHFTLEQL